MALTSASGTVPDFAAVRAEFALPTGFPAAVLAEAAEAAARAATAGPAGSTPPTSSWSRSTRRVRRTSTRRVGIARARRRVPGALRDRRPRRASSRRAAPLDAEVRRRGQTVYLPDGSVPLHPPVLSEGASSLLPGRPAPGRAVDDRPRRARASARPSTCGGPRCAPGPGSTTRACRPTSTPGAPPRRSPRCPSWARCAGPWRSRRGAIELELPDQEVVPRRRGRLDHRGSGSGRPSRTGTRRSRCSRARRPRHHAGRRGRGAAHAARAPSPSAVEQLRRTAATLGIDWPDGATAAQVLSGLPRDTAAPRSRCAGRPAPCCGAPATRRSTGRRAPHRPPTPGTAGSARRTRTSPRRCGGSWTGSARRSASPSPRAPRCRSG